MPEANRRVAELLEELGDLLEITGEDRFKVRAYERAARALREAGADVSMVDDRALQSIPGVGRAIAAKIREYFDTGAIAALDELRSTGAPPELREIVSVPGVGPKAALRLWRELGIRTRDDLEAAARTGRLRTLRGFGARAEERIIEGLERVDETRLLLPDALALAREILAEMPEPKAYAGSLRRMCETIGDVDLLVGSSEPAAVMNTFATFGDVMARGETRCTIRTSRGVQVDLLVVPEPSFGAALQHFTGSKEHNVRLRELALRRGFVLSEHGLERDGEVVASRTEEDVYAALGMPWIAPTLREDRGEIAAALAGTLPRLLEASDIRGDLQTHSTYSDGRAALQRMVAEAVELGYEYYAVTDHGQALSFMSQRLTPDAIARQREEIALLRTRVPLHLLHGVELNVAADGALDYPDEVLAGFDIVVASIHHELRADRETMTRRLLRAIENPYVSILGHPTTRRLGHRPESDIDLDAVFAAAASEGVAVEINSLPERLDIRDEHIFVARRHGCVFAVDSDGHSPEDLAGIVLGVATAQRGWVTPDEVINTWPWERLDAFLRARRPDRRGR